MRHRLVSLMAIFAFLSPLGADGLVYRLPEDGGFVRFDLEIKEQRGDQTKSMVGSLTMASVGQKEVDGKKCRWIEFKMVMRNDKREQVNLIKVLVPEQFLKAGASPVEHIVKGWFGRPGQDAKQVEGNKDRLGPVVAFLCGPFKDSKKQPAEDIATKLGKLSCPGVSGTTMIKEGNGTTVEIAFANRLHDKAAFGVVSSQMKFKALRADGAIRDQGILTLKLAEVGKMAKSELPD